MNANKLSIIALTTMGISVVMEFVSAYFNDREMKMEIQEQIAEALAQQQSQSTKKQTKKTK